MYPGGVGQEVYFELASERVTEHRSAVIAAAEEVAAISAEADVVHPIAVAAEAQPLLRCGGAPHFHCAISRGGGD